MENEKVEQKQEGNNKPVSEIAQMADRLEKANAEAKELLKRNEEIYARMLLGGKVDAGIQPKEQPTESPAEYAKRITGRK